MPRPPAPRRGPAASGATRTAHPHPGHPDPRHRRVRPTRARPREPRPPPRVHGHATLHEHARLVRTTVDTRLARAPKMEKHEKTENGQLEADPEPRTANRRNEKRQAGADNTAPNGQARQLELPVPQRSSSSSTLTTHTHHAMRVVCRTATPHPPPPPTASSQGNCFLLRTPLACQPSICVARSPPPPRAPVHACAMRMRHACPMLARCPRFS